jgi:hypothetical protein
LVEKVENNFYTVLAFLRVQIIGQMLVAHTYNSSDSGGRNQEDHGSKPAQAKCSRDFISKKPFKK